MLLYVTVSCGESERAEHVLDSLPPSTEESETVLAQLEHCP